MTERRNRLDVYLRAKRLSMRELATMCELPQSTLSRISETTSAATLRKIERGCDLNVEWLLSGRGEMLNHAPKSTTYNTASGGDFSTNMVGTNNNATQATDVTTLLRLLEKKDEQINRLIALLEKQ